MSYHTITFALFRTHTHCNPLKTRTGENSFSQALTTSGAGAWRTLTDMAQYSLLLWDKYLCEWTQSVLSWHDYVWMTNECGAQSPGVWYTAQGAHCLRAPTGQHSNCARLKNCTLLGAYDSIIPPLPSWRSHSKQEGVTNALHSHCMYSRTNNGKTLCISYTQCRL